MRATTKYFKYAQKIKQEAAETLELLENMASIEGYGEYEINRLNEKFNKILVAYLKAKEIVLGKHRLSDGSLLFFEKRSSFSQESGYKLLKRDYHCRYKNELKCFHSLGWGTQTEAHLFKELAPELSNAIKEVGLVLNEELKTLDKTDFTKLTFKEGIKGKHLYFFTKINEEKINPSEKYSIVVYNGTARIQNGTLNEDIFGYYHIGAINQFFFASDPVKTTVKQLHQKIRKAKNKREKELDKFEAEIDKVLEKNGLTKYLTAYELLDMQNGEEETQN